MTRKERRAQIEIGIIFGTAIAELMRLLDKKQAESVPKLPEREVRLVRRPLVCTSPQGSMTSARKDPSRGWNARKRRKTLSWKDHRQTQYRRAA